MPAPFGVLARCCLIASALVPAAGTTAHAQGTAPAPFAARRAFAPSLTPWIGLRTFGTRHSAVRGTGARGGAPNFEYDYTSGVAGGVRGEVGLSRRTGLMADLAVVPLSNFAERSIDPDIPPSEASVGRARIWSADVGVAARLKPTAPVYFFLGAGAVGASRHAAPLVAGSPVEPQGTVAVGYDRFAREGKWSFRAVFANHFVRPADTGAGGVRAKSLAYDWTLQLGGRVSLSRPPAADAP